MAEALNQPAEILSKNPLITFKTKDVVPPSAVYIDVQERLQIQINTLQAASIMLTTRLLRAADGVIVKHSQLLIPTLLSYASQDFNIFLTEGFLLSLTLTDVIGSVQPAAFRFPTHRESK